ncbi:MAG: hypothetical protein WBP45_05355 [Daejeonella sp.]
MKALITAILLVLAFNLSFAQSELKDYFPVSIIKPDLSAEREQEILRQAKLLEKENLTGAEKTELDSLLKKYGEFTESVWNIRDGDCSWYCGGGSYKVKSSSGLSSQNPTEFKAKSADDNSYKTAWVEGKEDEGKGEYLEFFFKNESPRITSIIVCNGYMKSETAWKNNNRVKKLKLFINNKAAGVLNLEDSRSNQEFKVGTLGRNPDKKDLVLKFEILEVYKGEKYNDTAITEIYFDGIDVH